MTNRPMSSQIGVDPMERKLVKKKPCITLILFFPPYYVFKEKYTNKDSGSKGNVNTSASHEVTTRMQLANCPRNYHCVKRVKHECVVIIPKAFFNYFVSSSLRKKKQQNIPSSCIRMLVFSRFLARATSWSVTLVQIRILNTAKISTIKTKCFSNTMEFCHELKKPRHFYPS